MPKHTSQWLASNLILTSGCGHVHLEKLSWLTWAAVGKNYFLWCREILGFQQSNVVNLVLFGRRQIRCSHIPFPSAVFDKEPNISLRSCHEESG